MSKCISIPTSQMARQYKASSSKNLRFLFRRVAPLLRKTSAKIVTSKSVDVQSWLIRFIEYACTIHICTVATSYQVFTFIEKYRFKTQNCSGQYCKSYQSKSEKNSIFQDFKEISSLNFNSEALLGVVGGMFFTGLASVLILLIRRTKQGPKFM